MTVLDPDTQLCVSGDVYAEYEEVLPRPKFKRSDSEIEAALRTIRDKGFWVKPTETVRACSDPDDDIFLECAQAAAAHYLVTGNVNDFPVTWAGTQIVTARQFIDAVI
jgi:putative PIN family toxin of toxin-antitoxin system